MIAKKLPLFSLLHKFYEIDNMVSSWIKRQTSLKVLLFFDPSRTGIEKVKLINKMSKKVPKMEQVCKGTFQLQAGRVYRYSATNCHLTCKVQVVNLLGTSCFQFLNCTTSKIKRKSLTRSWLPQLCLSLSNSMGLAYSVNVKTKESFWTAMLQKPLHRSTYSSPCQVESAQEWSLPWWWHCTHWWYSQVLLECWSVWTQGNSRWLLFRRTTQLLLKPESQIYSSTLVKKLLEQLVQKHLNK